ncbi:MAG: glycogen debranching protein GlgX [Cyclobacteriaceae bacterium]|nr:glycogen debranching protein GlgX [Cyclobacteriaceae bacterium]
MKPEPIVLPPEFKGQSFPIGPTLHPDGANFCLFSKHSTGVELLLFDTTEDTFPSRIIRLNPNINKTYHYWHTFVPGIRAGQRYGYRVIGPYDPHHGHWFDGDKTLLDPYAKAVAVPRQYQRNAFCKFGDAGVPAMKSVVCDTKTYDWENDEHPRRPFSKTIIYEMHVAGFTKNPNSGVSPEKRGTFLGLIEKIPYLVDLGVTAVELLPVFQFDAQDCPPDLVNYWGYSPVSFFAIHQAYGTSDDPLKVLDEFRDMVKALHRAGIEVLLDVVFNHTAEGGQSGPTLSFRGIDNSIYYTLERDKSQYANYSGTGNTLNANQSIVRRMISDSLHFWVKEMHVDGFRFDLAAILSRDEKGMPIETPPVLWDIESDPVLAGTKLIAEAWDAAGLYQVGSFVGDSWKEWNGKFRDDIRSFMKGDNGGISRFATRVIGSPDMYGDQNREPEQSINFVTCHDGFTLNDLVSYNHKHNEANKEDNRDGSNNDMSWNFGIEGPSADPQIEMLRARQVRNFLMLTLWSIGAPMILMGDEVRRTQHGNNNAYCQDNELSWFDWNLVNQCRDLFRFVKLIIEVRSQRDTARDEFSMSLSQLLDRRIITWHGVKLNQPDWSDHSHSIAVTVQSLSGDTAMHYMINAFTAPLEFEVPTHNDSVVFHWRRWIDTSLPSPDDICQLSDAAEISNNAYVVNAHTCVILVARLS